MSIYELLLLLVPQELRLALRVLQNMLAAMINIVEELIEFQRKMERIYG